MTKVENRAQLEKGTSPIKVLWLSLTSKLWDWATWAHTHSLTQLLLGLGRPLFAVEL